MEQLSTESRDVMLVPLIQELDATDSFAVSNASKYTLWPLTLTCITSTSTIRHIWEKNSLRLRHLQ